MMADKETYIAYLTTAVCLIREASAVCPDGDVAYEIRDLSRMVDRYIDNVNTLEE